MSKKKKKSQQLLKCHFEGYIVHHPFNLTCLLNGLEFLNPNINHLLNRSVKSTCLSNFIKIKK